MTREEAAKGWRIMKAYAEGAKLQWKHKHENEPWKDLKKDEEFDYPSDVWEFRVKS